MDYQVLESELESFIAFVASYDVDLKLCLCGDTDEETSDGQPIYWDFVATPVIGLFCSKADFEKEVRKMVKAYNKQRKQYAR